MSRITHRLARTAKSLPALAIGACGGATFYALGLPLPWVLGSIASITCVALTNKIEIGVLGEWRAAALVVIGLMLGSRFDHHTVGHMIS